MNSKRDLWILGGTSLLIAAVLFVAISVGTRHQQQAQVEELWQDVARGHNEKVRQLVSKTDVLDHAPRSNLGSLLFLAILSCDPYTVQTLIDKGVKVNSRIKGTDTKMGRSVLDCAVIFRRADMVEVLLRNGANPNLKTDGKIAIDRLKDPFINIPSYKRVGTDAQIAHLLREAQRKGNYHP